MIEMTEEEFRLRMLDWRGVEDPCLKCNGSGVRAYGSTSTWRGGVGGCAITSDVCDTCWGSGDRYRAWCNLRRLRDEEGKRIAEAAVELLARAAGVQFQTARGAVYDILKVIEELANAAGNPRRGKRHASFHPWTRDMARTLANTLRRALGAPEAKES